MSMTLVNNGLDNDLDNELHNSESDSFRLDRRRGRRVVQNRPLKIYEPFASRFFAGRTHDVSSTGMCIEFAKWAALSPGRVINVHAGVATGGQPLANRRSMIPARVVWVREHDNTLLAGIEFLSGIHASAA